jgi:hypothetical protein
VKKQQVDHVLRAAGRIAGDDQFIIIGSQSLHGKFPDLPDELLASMELDLYAKNQRANTELPNVIGQDSEFHRTYGYYADPVDERTAVLPKGWQARLINLPAGDTGGVRGLCLDPHDLAISKYVARREKDVIFMRELVRRGCLDQAVLLARVADTPTDETTKARILQNIARDFDDAAASAATVGICETCRASPCVCDKGGTEPTLRSHRRTRPK